MDKSPDTAALVSREWHSLIEPLLPVAGRMAALMPDADRRDPQLRQELYRMAYSAMSAGYLSWFLGDAEHPSFWPVWNPAYEFFAPCPDDAYHVASISGDGVYRISGFRGTVRLVDFAIGMEEFIAHGIGDQPGAYVDNYDIDSLKIGPDGGFEVILSAERPAGYAGNWWKLDARATHVLVRQRAYDWLGEIDGRYAIERLDRPALRPRPDARQIEAALRKIPLFVENWMTFSLTWIERLRARALVNKIEVHGLYNTNVGGQATQHYIEGLFDLAPDEALIYETEIPERCRYWNIELTNMLWMTIDYANRQSNLNGHTAKLDGDGRFRAVICASDPGVPNWLDTAGYAQGELFGRWTQASSAPTPTVTKVKLAELRRHLPADTPIVSAADREAAIRLRRQGAQLRRRW